MPKFFTRPGYENHHKRIDKLRDNVEKLQSQVASTATPGNTFHDNAEYEHLVEDIRLANSRLNDAHALANDAQVIDYPEFTGRVSLGSRVRIDNNGEKCQYDIVAYGESDPANNKILYDSPLAANLMGKKVGENSVLNLGRNKRVLSILEVKSIE